jgi:hypothetical protein
MEIDNILDIIKIGLASRNNWFRGHTKKIGKLIPAIFRMNYHNPITNIIKPDIESEFIQRFIL